MQIELLSLCGKTLFRNTFARQGVLALVLHVSVLNQACLFPLFLIVADRRWAYLSLLRMAVLAREKLISPLAGVRLLSLQLKARVHGAVEARVLALRFLVSHRLPP